MGATSTKSLKKKYANWQSKLRESARPGPLGSEESRFPVNNTPSPEFFIASTVKDVLAPYTKVLPLQIKRRAMKGWAGSIRGGHVLKRARKDRRDHARKEEIRAHPTVSGFCGSGIWPGTTGGQNDYGVWTIDSLF